MSAPQRIHHATPSLVITLAVAFLFGSGFVPLADGPESPRWNDSFPVVGFRVEPATLPAGSPAGALDALRAAADAWSYPAIESHLIFQHLGATTLDAPFSPAELACSESAREELAAAPNLVFGSAEEDPDCTAEACALVWSCAGAGSEILHFDIQVNAAHQGWEAGAGAGTRLDLRSVLTHHLGHVAGLGHCAPGETPSACAGRAATTGGDPPADAVMHRYPATPASPRHALAADDRAGLDHLYGALSAEQRAARQEIDAFGQAADAACQPHPCRLPEDEEDGRYLLTAEEVDARAEFLDRIAADGLTAEQHRRIKATMLQKLHHAAMGPFGEPAERILLAALGDVRANLPSFSDEGLVAGRLILAVQIEDRHRMLEDVSDQMAGPYREFTRGELKILIQLRRMMIDELERRGLL